MKKMKFMLLAVAAMAAASCAKEIASENNPDRPEVNLVPMTFTAGAEATDTKVALQSDGKTLHWESTDKIKVFDGISNELPAFTTTGSGASVDFTGNVSDGATGPFYALYPYQAEATFDSNGEWSADDTRAIIYAEVPATQTAVAGSVPSDAFIAVAKSDSEDYFKFMSVCGYVKFTLNDDNAENIQSITLSGNNNESIAGKVKIAFKEDGTPENTYVGGMSTTVTLTGSFQNGKDYYFAVRSSGFTKGITLSALYKDGTRKHISSSNAPASKLSRNQVMNLGSPTMKSGTPNDLYIAWNHGFDIDIAGLVINKKTHSTVTHIHANSDSKAITAAGTYFIDPDIDLTLSEGPYNGLYIIGNNPTVKTTVNITSTIQWATNSTLALKNVVIQEGDGMNSNLFKAVNGGSVLIDNCKLVPTNCTTIYSYQSNLENIKIHNSDILVSKDNTPVLIGAGANQTIIISTLELYNNIIYSADGDKFGFRVLDHTGISVTTLNIKKNTFANVFNYNIDVDTDNEGCYKLTGNTKGYLNCKVNTYTLTDNLFYTPTYDNYKNSSENSASTYILSPEATSISANNNMHLKTSNNNRLRTCQNGDFLSRSTTENDIVSNVDLSVGTIVSKGTYGAIR